MTGYEVSLRDQVQRSGLQGFLSQEEIARIRQARIASAHNNAPQISSAIVDPAVDQRWALQDVEGKPPHSYFDYYFTGQDIKVYMDGVLDGHWDAMPISDLSFSIQQNKLPIYGFWSYSFDAVAYGNRIVNGAFRIVTTRTNYMVDMLTRAAQARIDQSVGHEIRGFDEREENINKYWNRHVDPKITQTKHPFHSHPPFNFVIVYGIQSTSITEDLSGRNQEWEQYAKQGRTNTLVSTINERLVDADDYQGSQRWILEHVNLTAMEIEYNPDGAVCAETYAFFARDCYSPKWDRLPDMVQPSTISHESNPQQIQGTRQKFI